MKITSKFYKQSVHSFWLIVALWLILPHTIWGRQEQIIDYDSLPYTLQTEYAEVPHGAVCASHDSLKWKDQSLYNKEHYAAQKRIFLARSEFSFNSPEEHRPLYLCVSPCSYICRIYLNGHLLALRGAEPPCNEFQFMFNQYLIPNALLRKNGEKNTLLCELTSNRNNEGSFPQFGLMPPRQASHYTFVHNPLNIDSSRILFALGIINTFLFFIIFFHQKKVRKDLRYLLFAIMSLSYGMSYIDYAFCNDIACSEWLQKISILALHIALLASTLFVATYYRLFPQNKKLWRYLYAAMLVYFAGNLVWVSLSQAWEVANLFNDSIARLIIPILSIDLLVCMWFLWKKPCWKNGFMVIAYASATLGTCMDGLYDNVAQYTPFSLLFMICTLLYLFGLEFSLTVKKLYAKEEILRHQNETMEKIIHQRTRELEINNGKLSDAVAELKNSNAVKDRFFSIMAHDIKNPLNAMIGFSNLLQDSYEALPDDDRKEFIHQINIGANGLYKLLENLLEWSRIQIGTTKCCPDSYPLADLISMVSPLVEGSATAKNVHLKYAYPKDAFVFVDKNMLVTILRNLLGNAIKFSYPGNEVELTIRTDQEGFNEFSVADHGTGMSKNRADHLFRIDSIQSTPGTNQEQGTGIGLILCNEFINIQGGEIHVQSEEGKGTCITFRLPKTVLPEEKTEK